MVSSGRYDMYSRNNIAERTKYKQNKYVDLRLGIKSFITLRLLSMQTKKLYIYIYIYIYFFFICTFYILVHIA